MLTRDQWDHHWKMAALQTKDTVEKKGRKAYALPSILVLDISRLGTRARYPPGHGSRSSSTCWTAATSVTLAAS